MLNFATCSRMLLEPDNTFVELGNLFVELSGHHAHLENEK
jgi:hypothetical protein